MQGGQRTVVRVAVSGAALVLLVVHLLLPAVKVDAVTLGLVAVAAVPWLSSIFESFELPGGWKVKYRALQAAGEVFEARAGKQPIKGEQGPAALALSDVADPALRLASLSAEIEKRLRKIGRRRAMSGIEKLSLPNVLATLTEDKLLDPATHNSLALILEIAHQVVRGGRVGDDVGEWAARVGPVILAHLDEVLLQSGVK